jgi:poly(A) polymerase
MPVEREAEDDLGAYAGRWVAILGGRVVGQGGTPEQARRAAKSARSKEVAEVRYIATNSSPLFSHWVERVRQILPPEMRVYLVGGAVRDALLQRDSHDLDFVIPGEAVRAARRVADALGGAFYLMDEQRQTARVILMPQGEERLLLDFATLRGDDLESDLQARDFTINAIAIDIHRPEALLDPLGGAGDLLAKRLRACSPQAFASDPVRILRAVRLASAYQMKIDLETRGWMRQEAGNITRVSAERLRDELFRIFAGPNPALVLRALDMLGVLETLLPEIVALKGVDQSPPHTQDVFGHTLDTLHKLEQILEVLAPVYHEELAANLMMGLVSLRLGRYRERIDEHLKTELTPGRSIRSLLFLAALFHDSGKPETRQVEPGGRIRYFEHERVGEGIAGRRARAFNLSGAEVSRVTCIVRHHMRLSWLAQRGGVISRRTVYRFFRDTQSAGVEVCLLALADVCSRYGAALPQEVWARHLEVAQTFLSGWWEQPQKAVAPPALVSGDTLMAEFSISPGPEIGRLLEAIREAQAGGEVENQAQALELARNVLEGKIALDDDDGR